MLLAIDVGNTNAVVGVYNDDKLCAYFRFYTDKHRTSDEIGMLLLQYLSFENIRPADIKAVIVSSVVPPIMHTLNNAVKKYIGKSSVVIHPGMDTGLKIKYDNPSEVGADRIVNAVAAYSKYGGPCIIVDFGTATTFCAVSKEGDYLGGVITPGIKISMDALFERAAKLPRVELIKPSCVIGKNTVESMQSGAVFGYAGQVDHIIEGMKNELNAPECKAIATGGLAKLIAPETKNIDAVDSLLTLEGLKIIYKKLNG